MDLKKAKSFVEEMLDICRQLEDEVLTEACAGIYNDIKAARSTSAIIRSAGELMVFINESPWEDAGLSELKYEAEEIFNRLLEENEES